MTEQSDLIRSGNRFRKMLDDGQKAKVIAREAGITTGAFWKAVYAARDNAAPVAPEPAPDAPWWQLSGHEIAVLHAIRDEIRAADRRAMELEIEQGRLRG